MMDDPWGSPWAATDGDKELKPGSPAKSDIAPPPRAFLSASSSPRIPAVLEQSPWGGDETGFGEWTTPSETPAHSVWAGAWGGSSPNLLTPRDDLLGKSSPIALPGNIATPKPANGSTLRQPSPDPWGSGFSSRRPSNDAVSTPRLVVEAASPADSPIDVLKGNALGIEESAAVWDKIDGSADGHAPEQHTILSVPDTVVSDPISSDTVDEAKPSATPGIDVRSSVESTSQNREDHSSAPSNDNTDHEGERQDSPITSIDEEPKEFRPGARKLSGKVQELVVKFDGLARAASEERSPVLRTRSISPSISSKKDDFGDEQGDAEFGDFEDANVVSDADADADADAGAHVDEKGPPLQPEESAREGPEDSSGIDSSGALSFPSPKPPLGTVSPIAKFGPLEFSVDLESVAKLFAPIAESSHGTGVDHDVPDHVINDSFTEISQRKTWYRISRLGSSRRHDAGDDESYRRVAWASSTIHADTIKIVRRWMEEDSIAGRVALGGGVSKTQKNMFGWDSSAEPVALDAVFKKKTLHSRTSSTPPVHPATLSLKSVDAPAEQFVRSPTHRSSGSAESAVASFGWSSSLPPPALETRTASIVPELPSTTVPGTAPQLSLTQGGKHDTISSGDDDDDDWGEMVSSPVSSQPITLPLEVQKHAPEPISTALFPQQNAVDASDNDGPAPETPFDTAGLSDSELAPAKPATHGQTYIVNPKFVEPEAPVPRSKTVTGFMEPATSHEFSTPPPLLKEGIPPSRDAQNNHEQTAERIIASLPNLSYMLR